MNSPVNDSINGLIASFSPESTTKRAITRTDVKALEVFLEAVQKNPREIAALEREKREKLYAALDVLKTENSSTTLFSRLTSKVVTFFLGKSKFYTGNLAAPSSEKTGAQLAQKAKDLCEAFSETESQLDTPTILQELRDLFKIREKVSTETFDKEFLHLASLYLYPRYHPSSATRNKIVESLQTVKSSRKYSNYLLKTLKKMIEKGNVSGVKTESVARMLAAQKVTSLKEKQTEVMDALEKSYPGLQDFMNYAWDVILASSNQQLEEALLRYDTSLNQLITHPLLPGEIEKTQKISLQDDNTAFIEYIISSITGQIDRERKKKENTEST